MYWTDLDYFNSFEAEHIAILHLDKDYTYILIHTIILPCYYYQLPIQIYLVFGEPSILRNMYNQFESSDYIAVIYIDYYL